MALTKSDLEEMMKRQKEERKEELDMLKKSLMQGVKHEIQEQLAVFREEVRKEIAVVRNEVKDQIDNLEDKQTEMSDVQTILDCRIDKLEEELKAMRDLTAKDNSDLNDLNAVHSDINDASAKLVKHAMRVVGFKPIELRDMNRLKRMENIEDDDKALIACIREFLRCELRIPSNIIDELVDNIKKVWHPAKQEWDRLFVEFGEEKFVKVCFSYAKNLRDKDVQIMQYFSPEFSDQFRTLDSIAYQLRHPDSHSGIRYKTRIRYGKAGLELERRHPDQKVWNRVSVPGLPPVDLDPVPPPTTRSSPPSRRPRSQKRPLSPSDSPPSTPSSKSSKPENEVVLSVPISKELSVSNPDQAFQFQNLVNKFISK